ncbi:MAG: cbb3-type cytochrome oxidase assembly protein CcoS [Cycloclasticus sp.]|nr:MAG: cytochrome C oxidase Cbb3 [Neptuniibacter sp. Phe_28]MBV1913466.1 cbb3-type cytochrome oxidase assembly protein CcoS [Cycloclasticus sp.]
MGSLYFLIPVSVILVGLIAVIFLWAVRSGQFDDLDGPAHSILFEEEVDDELDKEPESNDSKTE